MIYIGNYKEFETESKVSMKDFFEKEGYENQEKIAEYLKSNGKNIMVSASYHKDVFTSQSTGIEEICKEDGKYRWFNILAYYVEKYNLRLPEDFEIHILGKITN